MSKKKLNGDGVTYENQAGVLVVDITSDDGKTLRFIFEDSFSYMVALLHGKEVLKTDSVWVDEVIEALTPTPEGDEAK